MMESNVSSIDLNSLSTKQLVKEYKTVGKEIKSKDPVIKDNALEKLKDSRYLTVGGCLPSLVESMIPKKKTLETNKKVLGIFDVFVGQPSFTGSVSAGIVQQSLQNTLNNVGDLEMFKIISDLMLYREEVKVVKPKKGEPIPIFLENEVVVHLRVTSLKVFCSIASSLSLPNCEDHLLCHALANVTSLADSIIAVLLALKSRYENESSREGMLQEGRWALVILIFVLRNNAAAMLVLLSGDTVSVLQMFCREESFSLFCLQIFELISLATETAAVRHLNEELALAIADVMLKVSEDLSDCIESAVSIPTSNAPSKVSKEKVNKKEKSLSDALPKIEKAEPFKQSRRQSLACIKIAATTLTAICERNGSAITRRVIDMLAQSFTKALLEKTGWELAQSPTAEPFDVDLSDTFDRCCIFLGAVGLLERVQRKTMCEAGVIPVLFVVLQNSMGMFNCTLQPSNLVSQSSDDNIGKKERLKSPKLSISAVQSKGSKIGEALGLLNLDSEEEGKKLIKVRALRRVAEKALLSLITENSSELVGNQDPSRWLSARSKYAADIDLFLSSIAAESSDSFGSSLSTRKSGPLFPSSLLMEVIASGGDIDLGNRGIRILSALLEGVDDPISLLHSLNLDQVGVNSISNAVQARVTALLNAIEAKRIETEKIDQALVDKQGTEAFDGYQETKGEPESDPHGTEGEGEAVDITNQSPDIKGPETEPQPDVLFLDEGEVLYHCLIILEKVLSFSSMSVSTFSTRERFTGFTSLLYRCGPTRIQRKRGEEVYDSKESKLYSAPSSSSSIECEIDLHDPRNYLWYPTGSELNSDKVLLRPLIFDILALIASAEQKYRVYDAEVPTLPVIGAPLLTFTSACKEAALTACKLCGDAVVSTLLVQGTYQLYQPPSQVTPRIMSIPSNPDKSLDRSVMDSALGSLLAMTSCGAIGLYAILESVADTGITGIKEFVPGCSDFNALSGLKQFLFDIPETSVLGTEFLGQDDDVVHKAATDAKSSLTFNTMWSRSLLFDQLFTGLSFETTPSAVLLQPLMWPYLAICTSLIGVLASIEATVDSVSLAIDVVTKLCRVDQLSIVSQPVVADSFSVFFLSLGGALAVAGAIGRFGTLRPGNLSILLNSTNSTIEARDRGLSLLKYLTGRGRERELYWLSRVPAVVDIPLDPKAKAAAAANALKASKKEASKPTRKSIAKASVSSSSSSVEDVVWNLVADDTHPDPNHGPTRGFWKFLLENSSTEHHTATASSTLMSVAIVGGLKPIVLDLMEERAGVHISDQGGVFPLMYALALGDSESASALLAAGANIDAVDAQGNPTVIYACHSMTQESVDTTLFGPVALSGERQTASVLGFCPLLQLLLDADADVGVCDEMGRSPLLSALGLGTLTLTLGGYTVKLSNSSYADGCSRDETMSIALSLVCAGVLVNACNREGVVPLHIAAARGHEELIILLKDSGAIANAEDEGGYLPLHYAAAACPLGAPEIFDLLMEHSKFRPVRKMNFADNRTGLSKGEKYEGDVARKMDLVFEDSLRVTGIQSARLSEEELLQRLPVDCMNILQLCLSTHTLQLNTFHHLISGGKYERMELAQHLINKSTDINMMLSNRDCWGMTVMHAASLLFQGITPVRELTPQELRSKRVKTYRSLELKLLDIFLSIEGVEQSAVCTRLVPWKGFGPKMDSFPWTPLHGAISGDNADLVKTLLLDRRIDCSLFPYAHFLSQSFSGAKVCDIVIAACASSSSHSSLLSGSWTPWTSPPLHVAARSGNTDAIHRLLKCSKVDPNLRDSFTGMTAVHEACVNGNLDVLRTFGAVSDRIDLLTFASDGKTCIETAIESKNVEMLVLLVKMRRNDVLERILHARPGSPGGFSLLMQLEFENMAIARALGYGEGKDKENGVDVSDEENQINREQEDVLDSSNQIEVSVVESLANMTIENDSSQPMVDDDVSIHNDLAIYSEVVERTKVEIASSDIATEELLLTSDLIVSLLIIAAAEAGIISQEFHAHICYSQGLVYREYTGDLAEVDSAVDSDV